MTEREVLLGLLRETAAAHGEHEKTELGGEYDERWPEWYADFMVRALHDAGYRLVKI
ncbi:MAG TPA: hypothetical protein VNR36_08265 [Pseudolysinimonas sp.]|nr:hypothetical protein [Pseudolysinimonas sp.]